MCPGIGTTKVVVTNYNKPEWMIERCLQSISDIGLGFILVDDCSMNPPLDKKHTSAVRLKENVGAYASFMEGLNRVDTEFVMRVDADDYITGFPTIHGDFDGYIQNIDGKVSIDPEQYLDRPYCGINGSVIKTAVMKDIWPSDMRFYGDIVAFARLITRYRVTMVEERMYVYDQSASWITKMDDRLGFIEMAKSRARKEIITNKKGGYCECLC